MTVYSPWRPSRPLPPVPAPPTRPPADAHTPTPWHAITVDECTVRAGRTTLFYGSVGNLRAEADAAFVVRACNAHDELVAALRAVVAAAEQAEGREHDTLEDDLESLLSCGDAIDGARAALAKAAA